MQSTKSPSPWSAHKNEIWLSSMLAQGRYHPVETPCIRLGIRCWRDDSWNSCDIRAIRGEHCDRVRAKTVHGNTRSYKSCYFRIRPRHWRWACCRRRRRGQVAAVAKTRVRKSSAEDLARAAAGKCRPSRSRGYKYAQGGKKRTGKKNRLDHIFIYLNSFLFRLSYCLRVAYKCSRTRTPTHTITVHKHTQYTHLRMHMYTYATRAC